MRKRVKGGEVSPAAQEGRTIDARPLPGFVPREGDRLTVCYTGAKLQIAPFSTVELDSGIYSRILEVGDDPVEQWDRVYAYLRDKTLEGARAKLSMYVAELAEAKSNLQTQIAELTGGK
jgi:hypothetical protein